MENHKRPPATLLFIFGGSGDLNFRKFLPLFIICLLTMDAGKIQHRGHRKNANIPMKIIGAVCWKASNNSAGEKMLPMHNGRIFRNMFPI